MLAEELTFREQCITMNVTEALSLIHRLTAAVISARGHADGEVIIESSDIEDNRLTGIERRHYLVVKAK
jgi:hypothetical protein